MNTPNPSSLARFQRVVGQLRELLANGTPGPWQHGPAPHQIDARGGLQVAAATSWNDVLDRNLIVAAVNALPALLAIAEAAQSYVAIRHPNGDLMTTTTFSPEMDKAAVCLLDALSLLPNHKADVAPASGAHVQRVVGRQSEDA